MKNKHKIVLSLPQQEFITAQNSNVGLVAGFGSGKTEADLFRAFSTMFAYPKANLLYAAPTLSLINDIWYPKVEAFLENLGLDFHIHQSKNIIRVEGCGKMYCKSMEHPHKIVGFEVLDAYLDELDILQKQKALEVYRKARARCRQKVKLNKIDRNRFKRKFKKNQVLVSTTPEGFKATYHLFVKNKLKDSKLIQMSTYSNLHNLPEDYIEELKIAYPLQLVNAYIRGKFVNLTQGTIYNCYDRIKNRSILNPLKNEELLLGLDFNVGNMSAVTHIIRDGKPHAVSEIVNVLDTPNMIYNIKNIYGDRHITIFPDSSGKNRNTTGASITDLKLLVNAGFDVVADRTNPAVKDRINSMNALFCNGLKERRYFVNDFKCKNYADCLEQQVYDANGQPDKKNNLDHLPDAAGYFINKTYGINRNNFRMDEINV